MRKRVFVNSMNKNSVLRRDESCPVGLSKTFMHVNVSDSETLGNQCLYLIISNMYDPYGAGSGINASMTIGGHYP